MKLIKEVELPPSNDTKFIAIIAVLSVLIPVAVAFLLFSPVKMSADKNWVGLLPHLNAVLNTATSVALVLGFILIKKREIRAHNIAMLAAFFLGSLFLISYVVYHSAAPSTMFGDVNGDGMLDSQEIGEYTGVRTIYLIILLSHILLAIVVVPFVLFALFYAYRKQFEKHRKVVKYTFPIWLYVSITGVIVYLMISPFYQY